MNQLATDLRQARPSKALFNSLRGIMLLAALVIWPLAHAQQPAAKPQLLWQTLKPSNTGEVSEVTQISLATNAVSDFSVGDTLQIEHPWSVDLILTFEITAAETNELGVFDLKAYSSDGQDMILTLSQLGESTYGHLRIGKQSVVISSDRGIGRIESQAAVFNKQPKLTDYVSSQPISEFAQAALKQQLASQATQTSQASQTAPTPLPTTNSSEIETIDVHVVYDVSTVARFGSIAATLVRISAAMQVTNVIFERSDVHIRLNPIYGTYSGADPGITRINTAIHEDLVNIGESSAEFDAIRARTEQLGADHTIYYRAFGTAAGAYEPNATYCGTHSADYFMMEAGSQESRYQQAWQAPYNVNVMNLSCGSAHQQAELLGQHMGIRPRPGLLSGRFKAVSSLGYGHGEKDVFKTILANAREYQAVTLEVFSNPSLECAGRPCGTETDANSASVLNQYRSVFSSVDTYQALSTKVLIIDAKPGVNIDISGVNRQCNGFCVVDVEVGTPVSLVNTDTAEEQLFTGWEGACTVDENDPNRCDLIMTDHTHITAQSHPTTLQFNDAITNMINLPGVVALNDDSAPWRVIRDYSSSVNGVDKAVSAAIGDSEYSSLVLEVDRPGTLTFDIGVSSEADYDTLVVSGPGPFYRISGEVEKQSVQFRLLPEMTPPYQITLIYNKDGGWSSGADWGLAYNFAFEPISTEQHELTITSDGGGWINVNGEPCLEHCSYAFEHNSVIDLEAVSEEGEALLNWGGQCENVGSSNQCSIILVADAAISASFSGAPPDSRARISTLINGLGEVTPSQVTILKGQDVQFQLTPASGYGLATVDGCGGTLISDSIYYAENVQANCVVAATFKQASAEPVTVLVSGDANTIFNSPAGNVRVNKGETLAVQVTAAEGYVVKRAVNETCPDGGWVANDLFVSGKIATQCQLEFVTVEQPARQLINLSLITDANMRQCIADQQSADPSLEYFDQITNLDEACAVHDVTRLAGFNYLTHLEELRLQAPANLSELYNLRNLQYLRELTFNQSNVSLSGFYTSSMYSLTKFAYTDSTVDSVSISGMNRLRELDLSGTWLRSGAPSLNYFPTLERIDLSDNLMDQWDWKNWFNSVPNSALRSLNIANNDISQYDLGKLVYPSTLRELNARNTKVLSWVGLTATAPYLEKLAISDIESLADIQPLEQLRELTLSRTSVSDFELAIEFPLLQKLVLGESNAGASSLDALHAFSEAAKPLQVVIENSADYLCSSLEGFIDDAFVSVTGAEMCRLDAAEHKYHIYEQLNDWGEWGKTEFSVTARDSTLPSSAITNVRLEDNAVSFTVNPVDYELSGWHTLDFVVDVTLFANHDYNQHVESSMTVFVPSIQTPLSNMVLASPELARCLRNEAYYNNWKLAEDVTRIQCDNVTDLSGVEQLENLEFLAIFGDAEAAQDPLSTPAKPDLEPLRNLQNLRNLALVDLGLTNDDIADLAEFAMFRSRSDKLELHLTGNQLSDWAPLIPILETQQLWQFSVNRNLFTELPEQGGLFKNKHNEAILWLSDNPISAPEHELSKLAEVTHALDLSVEGWHLENSEAITWPANLTRLVLDRNDFVNSVQLAESLAPLTNLDILSVRDNQLLSLDGFGGLTSVTQLYASDNSLFDISGIDDMSNLAFLEVNNTMLDFFNWTLTKLPKLTTIDAYGNPNITCFTYSFTMEQASMLGGRNIFINHNMCGTDEQAFYIGRNFIAQDGYDVKYEGVPIRMATPEDEAVLDVWWDGDLVRYDFKEGVTPGVYPLHLIATVNNRDVHYRFNLERYWRISDIQFMDDDFAQCVYDTGAYYPSSIYELYCSNVSDLTGTQHFSQLHTLALTSNEGTELINASALKGNGLLKTLSIRDYNGINTSSLGEGIAELTELTNLRILNSGLTELGGITRNQSITDLDVKDNPLTAIDGIANMTALNFAHVSDTLLSDISPLLQASHHFTVFASAAGDTNPAMMQCDVLDTLATLGSAAPQVQTWGCTESAGQLRIVAADPAVTSVSVWDNGVSSNVQFEQIERQVSMSARELSSGGVKLIRVGLSGGGVSLYYNFTDSQLSQPLASGFIADNNLASCIAAQYPNALYTDEVTSITCEGVWDLTGAEKLDSLQYADLRNGHYRDVSPLASLWRLDQLLISSNVTTAESLVGAPRLSALDVRDNPYLSCEQISVLASAIAQVASNMCRTEEQAVRFFDDAIGWLAGGDLTISQSPIRNPGEFSWVDGELTWAPPANLAPGAYTFLLTITINGQEFSFYVTFYVDDSGALIGPPAEPMPVVEDKSRRGFPMWLIPVIQESQQQTN